MSRIIQERDDTTVWPSKEVYNSHTSENRECINYVVTRCLHKHVNQKAHVVCNYKRLIKTEGLLKVIGNLKVISRKRCKIETLYYKSLIESDM